MKQGRTSINSGKFSERSERGGSQGSQMVGARVELNRAKEEWDPWSFCIVSGSSLRCNWWRIKSSRSDGQRGKVWKFSSSNVRSVPVCQQWCSRKKLQVFALPEEKFEEHLGILNMCSQLTFDLDAQNWNFGNLISTKKTLVGSCDRKGLSFNTTCANIKNSISIWEELGSLVGS